MNKIIEPKDNNEIESDMIQFRVTPTLKKQLKIKCMEENTTIKEVGTELFKEWLKKGNSKS